MTSNADEILAQLRRDKDELTVRISRVEERLLRLEAERDVRAATVKQE